MKNKVNRIIAICIDLAAVLVFVWLLIEQLYIISQLKESDSLLKISAIAMIIGIISFANKPRTIDSSLLTIIDSQSREYSVLNDMNLRVILGDENIFLEEINPGMSLTGTFVFEVQKNINEYYLRISPGFISLRSDVTVKLK